MKTFYCITVGKRYLRYVEEVIVGRQAKHALQYGTLEEAVRDKDRVLAILRAHKSQELVRQFKKKPIGIRKYTIETISEEAVW